MARYSEKSVYGYDVLMFCRSPYQSVALLYREEDESYIVAPGYSEKDGTWRSGSYYSSLRQAKKQFMSYVDWLFPTR